MSIEVDMCGVVGMEVLTRFSIELHILVDVVYTVAGRVFVVELFPFFRRSLCAGSIRHFFIGGRL